MKRIMEDPDLKSVFEAVSGGCPLLGESDDVATMMGVSVMPSGVGSSGITIPIATIRRGNFDRESMAEQLQEDFAGALIEDYQGIEVAVIETAQGLRLASAFVDEVTWVFGAE
ncbi:unnamed protein product, partial [marine sediment metagenome]